MLHSVGALVACSRILYDREMLDLASAALRTHTAEKAAMYHKHRAFFEWVYPKADRITLLQTARKHGIRLCFYVTGEHGRRIPSQTEVTPYGVACDEDIHFMVHECGSTVRFLPGKAFYTAGTLNDQKDAYRVLHSACESDTDFDSEFFQYTGARHPRMYSDTS